MHDASVVSPLLFFILYESSSCLLSHSIFMYLFTVSIRYPDRNWMSFATRNMCYVNKYTNDTAEMIYSKFEKLAHPWLLRNAILYLHSEILSVRYILCRQYKTNSWCWTGKIGNWMKIWVSHLVFSANISFGRALLAHCCEYLASYFFSIGLKFRRKKIFLEEVGKKWEKRYFGSREDRTLDLLRVKQTWWPLHYGTLCFLLADKREW